MKNMGIERPKTAVRIARLLECRAAGLQRRQGLRVRSPRAQAADRHAAQLRAGACLDDGTRFSRERRREWLAIAAHDGYQPELA